MKILLLMVNLILGTAVLLGGVAFFRKEANKNKVAFTVKKRIGKKALKKTQAVRPAPKTPLVISKDEQIKRIVENNIFNQERCPNAGIFSNARVELTLVGTFRIGKQCGAVILQKSNARQMPAFAQMFGSQGRRMGIGRAGIQNRGQFNQGANASMSRRGAANTQIQAAPQRRQRGGAARISSVRNAHGAVIPGTANAQLSTNTNVTYKQYVRLGETLANGYKLVEVERNRVTLMRGSDKLELELVDASKNAPRGRSRPRKYNQNQVMQQMMNTMQNMQRMQNMQNWRMMHSMRQLNRNQSRSQGTAPRRR